MPDDPSPPGSPAAGAPASSARVQALYQETILDHYRRPRNRGELADATSRATVRNPLCGDALTMQVAVEGDVVREARFLGQGCSISQAAASMLTEAVRGRTRVEAGALLRDYERMVSDRSAAPSERLDGELRALSSVARFPARVRCGLLPAEALRRALGEAAPR